MRRVRVVLDGERVEADLLSAPNAIGLCEVDRRGERVLRYVSSIEPLDDGARELLGSGDKFVSRRAPDEVVSDAIVSPAKIREVSLVDLELLRIYALAMEREWTRRFKNAFGQSRAKVHERVDYWKSAARAVTLWLKQARMAQVAQEANLTAEEARDPKKLLSAAKTGIARLCKLYNEKTGGEVPCEIKRLVAVISDYLNWAEPGEPPQ